MDKLKPILAQKFWILFSVALIMPPIGYFMTKGKLAAEINDRKTKLEGAFTGIPAGTGVPNDSWSKALNDINERQRIHNRRANQELWTKQQERMFWPKDISPIMAKVDYFKDLTEEQKGGQVLYKYPLSYQSQLRTLWEIVDPLDDGVNFRDSDKRRKVAFPMADLHYSGNMLVTNFEPKFSEIWAAQEDIWLQTELLNAIRRLNANSISQGDAFVKVLSKIQLFGGTKSTGDAGAATSGAAMSSFAGETSGAMGMSMGGMGFSGQKSESGAASADITLGEEFAVTTDGGGGNVSPMGGSSGPSSGESSGAPGAAGGIPGAKPEVKRYLDHDEKQPYKRRGFYIKVTMDHRKVPDLIAELMNSPFPVEIVRVHQAWQLDSGSTSSGSGGPMSSGGPGGFSGFRPPSSGDSSALSPASSSPVGFTETSDEGAGAGALGSGAGVARSGASNPGSAAALADPNLAQVAILGVWTLYLPPPPATDAGQLAPTSSAVPAAGLASNPENGNSLAEPVSDAVAADSKPLVESPESDAGETKKPVNPDAAGSEPGKSEKKESEPSDSAAEKTPPKKDADEKTEPEKN